MRKVLVASILGFALSVTSSYGAGYIIMQNYDYVNGTTPVYAGVTYANGGGAVSGEFIGSANPYGIQVELFYSLTGAAGTFALAPGSLTSFYSGSPPGSAPSHDGGSPTTDGAGVFFGPLVTIPGYTSGNAFFFVAAVIPTQVDLANSAVFSMPLNTDPAVPSQDLLNLAPGQTTSQGLQSFSPLIPEPSILALSGIGAAALMLVRRKK
jgi:hypothetical protein